MKIAWLLIALSIVCVTVSGTKSVNYYQDMAEATRPGLSDEARRDLAASAYIKSAGRYYLWHLGSFVALVAGISVAYWDTKLKWARFAYAAIATVPFSLGTVFFLVADENVSFLTDGSHAFLFGSIIKAKFASALVALLSGGCLFEMLSALTKPDEK